MYVYSLTAVTFTHTHATLKVINMYIDMQYKVQNTIGIES